MSVQTFRLTEEFTDAANERALLAAIANQSDLYWELFDLLPAGVFVTEEAAWRALARAIEDETPLTMPDGWEPAADPQRAARHLADLYQRRLLAETQERLAAALYSEQPAAELASLLETEAARVQASVRELEAGQLLWAADLAPKVLAEAASRIQAREKTGLAITGISTGLKKLDELLNGLSVGLYILAGAPGAGKTTLALQLAMQAARDGVPVVYVTYENSPTSLVLKVLAAGSGISAGDVERGFADLTRLRRAASDLQPGLARLAVLEGSSRLTMAQVRARALQVLNRHKVRQCLVVFDYLQRASHGQGYDLLRHNVSALAGELRDLANRLEGPVLAISSQNRSSGNYGAGGGSASLDSLKESGDLEYSADAVLFLRPSEKRQANPPARAVDLVLAKNRFGDTGALPLIFRPEVGIMREEVQL